MNPELSTVRLDQQRDSNLLERLRNAATDLRTILARTALATLVVASGTLITTIEEVTHPTAAHADSLSYPWPTDTEAPCEFGSAGGASCTNPNNAYDKYDWGIIDASGHFQPYRNGYEYRNCTGYVEWKEESVGINIRTDLGNGGDWYTNSPNQQSSTPKPWDAAVVPATYNAQGLETNPGHVAFVESVNTDGTITVSEYNHDAKGDGDTRTGTAASMGFTEFVDFGVHPGGSQPAPAPPTSKDVAFNSVPGGADLTSDEGWVYADVAGRAWPIKHINDWTSADTATWGDPNRYKVPTDDVHNAEVGFTGFGRFVGAHPPAHGTDVFVAGSLQQYVFENGGAYPIGAADVDDLGVRDKALRVPDDGRLSDFLYLPLKIDNGSLYRYAGTAAVRQAIIQQPSGSTFGYWVNNETALECLELTQGRSVLILPQSAENYLVGDTGAAVTETWSVAGCSFPSNWVLFGPGGQEQWRIEGNNPYDRRYFPNGLTTYLNTGGNPQYHSFLTTDALNSIPQGPDMTPPNGVVFADAGSGQQFYNDSGVYRPIPWPSMDQCLGNPNVFGVPSNVVGALPQGPQMTCRYGNNILAFNGGTYYIDRQGMSHKIPNAVVQSCLAARQGAGNQLDVDQATLGSYPAGPSAYCNYGAPFFVHYANDPAIYLANPDGTLQHAETMCVPDYMTTQWTFWRAQQVPNGELDGYTLSSDWFASPATCTAVRAAWDAAGFVPA